MEKVPIESITDKMIILIVEFKSKNHKYKLITQNSKN